MKFKFKNALLAFAAFAMVGGVGAGIALGNTAEAVETRAAEETTFYTLNPAAGTNNSYAGNCDVTIAAVEGDGGYSTTDNTSITWNITGNSTMIPWRIGGKSLTAEPRLVYSKTAMPAAITKVSLTVGTASSVTVDSLKLLVYSDVNRAAKDKIDEVEVTFAASSTLTFKPTAPSTSWPTGSFYVFEFKVTIGGSNKFVQFSQAQFSYVPVNKVTGVSLNKNSTTINVGETEKLIATVAPANATDKTVSWSSDNTDIATVDSDGTVHGVAAGTASITVETNDGGFKASCAVSIVAAGTPVIDFDFITDSGSQLVFTGQEFVVTALYQDLIGDGVVFSIDTENSTATATDLVQNGDDYSGTFATAGTLIVVAQDNAGPTKEMISFVVTATHVTVELSKHATSIFVSLDEILLATVTTYGPIGDSIEWESDDTTVATVDSSGKVHAVAVGTANITVTSTEDPSAQDTCVVTVSPINVFEKVVAEEKIYAGMKVTLANIAAQKVATAIPTSSNKYIGVSTTNFVDENTRILDNDALVFTVSGTVGNWVLTANDWDMQSDKAKQMPLSGGTNTWSIGFDDDENVLITSTDNSLGQVYYNTTYPRFLNYASAQAAVQLYALAPENAIYAFIRDYMRMGDTNLAGTAAKTDTPDCKSGYYAAAKAAFNSAALTESERVSFFSDAAYTAAANRLRNWAAANSDSFNETTHLLSASPVSTWNIDNNTNATIPLVVTVISVGTCAAVGLFLVQRKRRIEKR